MLLELFYSILTVIATGAILSGFGIWLGRKEQRESQKARVDIPSARGLHEVRR